ncbi:ExbD/TolR family protein [Spiribacter halobius]|uniref:Biopolymer transporter ExbD n=1 Tax=Sediminicurvatus halobius TaxID=2182432 RepID=A0A2U2N413_9GAMM|nr:biopolymer transporter ExbD [Spiribacter halobius]PWG63719.1 biopolymer transporter ExbD [Spiribacter halobius]UEX79856.1 biopolymer transporter ExbD [Spiribacter halobius]
MNLPASAQPASLAADQRRRRPLVGLTPLIDVVFILLVFFMLASSFLDWRAIELNAPAEASVAGTLEGALLIEVRADDLRLGGEAISLGAVAQAVRGRLDEAPDTRVLVRPAEGVELQRAVDVLDRLSAAGVTDLSLIRAGAR